MEVLTFLDMGSTWYVLELNKLEMAQPDHCMCRHWENHRYCSGLAGHYQKLSRAAQNPDDCLNS